MPFIIKRISFISILLILFSFHIANGDSFNPWNFNSHEEMSSKSSMKMTPAAIASSFAIRFFRDYISPVDGDRCFMHPTCSSYSLKSIEKHGFIIGYIMTADRLIHENDEMDIAVIIKIGEERRFHDSVENNDFWWYKDENERKLSGSRGH